MAAGSVFLASSSPAEEIGALKLEKVAEGFVSPVGLVAYPGEEGLLTILDQVGVAWLVGTGGKRLPEPFLDLRSKVAKLNEGFDERGLLGLAFHPSFATNGRIFVYYSGPLREGAPRGWDHTSVIAEFRVKEGERSADLASEKVLLQIDEPQFNHNSGNVLFGPDGFLYISTGDGGAANDVGPGHVPGGNAQDPEQLLGKILRIDVDRGDPYGIPADNPFAGRDGRDEIFALGLRNPWGLAFLPDGRLILADIGQNRFEEVNIIEKGGNYGWNIREGFSGFDPDKAMDVVIEKPNVDAAGKPFAEPVLVYKNPKAFPTDAEARGASICGGYVYRGKSIPGLRNRYVFGDWTFMWGLGKGSLFSANAEGSRWELKPLPVEGASNGQIDSFMLAIGEGADGELYILTNKAGGLTGETGVVWKLVQG
ncbi:MAG TPA: PQQ-dependent sugar dehydrogenase [Verrucomicrobiales bacterium]|nr:PQQ-dependent sugar dehydrogenase [Verrucomicrobiales bacterium]